VKNFRKKKSNEQSFMLRNKQNKKDEVASVRQLHCFHDSSSTLGLGIYFTGYASTSTTLFHIQINEFFPMGRRCDNQFSRLKPLPFSP
jgi:hypothetical protein